MGGDPLAGLYILVLETVVKKTRFLHSSLSNQLAFLVSFLLLSFLVFPLLNLELVSESLLILVVVLELQLLRLYEELFGDLFARLLVVPIWL